MGGIHVSKSDQVEKLDFLPLQFVFTIIVGVVIWFCPIPVGVKPQAWHLFAVFVATIVGFIIKPLPMGSLAIIAITFLSTTGLVPISDALSGFSDPTIWLIVTSFFISRGFTKTGLGIRIAYLFVKRFGSKTLGLSYSFLLCDLLLAPVTPSNSARSCGIIYPIAKSLAEAFQSRPDDGTARRMGSFLTLKIFHVNLITSSMFVTAMAANPLVVSLAAAKGVRITWLGWMLAALGPGLLALLVVPLVIFMLHRPEITSTPNAATLATTKLKEMGSISRAEKYMLAIFFTILCLWISGDVIGIGATTTAQIGLSLLLLFQVLNWKDVIQEQAAWDTLVWFAALVMMASELNRFGLMEWFSQLVNNFVQGLPWITAFIILALIYYYSHYLFASATAHVSAMYATFLAVAISTGVPPMIAALILSFFSSLFASTTHYGIGSAPVLYGFGYVTKGTWWSIGFIISIIHIVIWLGGGLLWWKMLGLY